MQYDGVAEISTVQRLGTEQDAIFLIVNHEAESSVRLTLFKDAAKRRQGVSDLSTNGFVT